MHVIYRILCISTFVVEGILCRSEHAKCLIKLDLSICYSSHPTNVTQSCLEEAVCKKQFNITYVKLDPYRTEIVSDLLRTCCGQCIETVNANTVTSVSQITSSIMRTSHFVFPVLGRFDSVKLYGYHFIPLVGTPSIYYITARADNLINHLIQSCFNMWPLMIICFFMVIITGFLGWAMETRINKEQFPRHFLTGWFEGFWWSFISMTTVGYGDKVPITVPARLFSVTWIVVGISIFSLVTAMLSSEITKVNSQLPPTMSEANVGALPNRLYDYIVIANHGGVLVDITAANTTEGIYIMIDKLRNKEIDGFILDRYTLLVFYWNYKKTTNKRKLDFEFLHRGTIRTEITHAAEPWAYGILVKNDDDYEFLADFVLDNQDVLKTCNNLMINRASRELKVENVKNPLFATSGDIFLPTVITLASIILVICCFGFVYEYYRRNYISHKECGKCLII